MKVNNYLLLILIIISAVAISVCSYIYTPTKYSKYSTDVKTEPVMAPLLKGASAGIFPWTYVEEPQKTQTKSTVKKTDTKKSTGKTHSEQKPVKTFTQVDDNYFSDAVFIGDSRMLGLSQYCEPIDSRATFFAKKSLTIYDIQKDEWVETDDGREITLFDALSEITFSKVYIMVGINEIGTGNNESFREAYSDVINRILQIQPDAIVYINSIMHVSKEKSDSDPLYNNGNIDARNLALIPLVDGEHIFFLNVNDIVDDGEGNLNADLTSDGVHLKGSCYEPWHQYLVYNAIAE